MSTGMSPVSGITMSEASVRNWDWEMLAMARFARSLGASAMSAM